MSAYDIYHNIKRLSALAYPGEEDNTFIVNNNIGKFTELLNDPILRREFRMRRPKNLEEALRAAAAAQEEDAQVFGQMAARHRESDYDADRKRKTHGRSAEVQMGACAAPASDPAFAACLKEMEELR